ncbi:MAG TPA: GntG family PLP-dependent aldolase, partial [Gemmatimonadales bacterium]|nr:GntG family PLP-dependent aldolase [Gemmatimonadales bacterium]
PTTRRLEARVADMLGMADALFFPSGIQANQTGIALLTRPGTELLVEADAHLVHYEFGGVAANWGVQIRPIGTADGLLTAALLGAALRPPSPHVPRAGAVAVENTHNAAGGKVMPVDVMTGVVAAARAAGLAVHLDGARLWNAAAALGVAPAALTAGAATVMVSFSKGLGCPVGSCLAMRTGLIERAREIRRRLGGGMRQSGVLAAAALWALDHTLGRIVEDHANARRLAERLAAAPGLRVLPPESNIVMIDLTGDGGTAEAAVGALAREGVLVVPFGPKRLRAVTHLDVGRADVERAAEVMARALA